MATKAIWTDGEMLEVLEAASLCQIRREARLSREWATVLLDYALAWQGIERTGAKQHLTLPMARRGVLRLARRMGEEALMSTGRHRRSGAALRRRVHRVGNVFAFPGVTPSQ